MTEAPPSFPLRLGMIAGAVGAEDVGGAALDPEPDRVSQRDPAEPLVLGGDRLPVGKPRVDQSPLAEPLDQLDLGRRSAGAAARDPNALGPETDLQRPV